MARCFLNTDIYIFDLIFRIEMLHWFKIVIVFWHKQSKSRKINACFFNCTVVTIVELKQTGIGYSVLIFCTITLIAKAWTFPLCYSTVISIIFLILDFDLIGLNAIRSLSVHIRCDFFVNAIFIHHSWVFVPGEIETWIYTLLIIITSIIIIVVSTIIIITIIISIIIIIIIIIIIS